MNEKEFTIINDNLLKYFIKNDVFIAVSGAVNTNVRVNKANIIINRNKIIFINEESDFVIDLTLVKSINLEDDLKMNLIYDNFQIGLEV